MTKKVDLSKMTDEERSAYFLNVKRLFGKSYEDSNEISLQTTIENGSNTNFEVYTSNDNLK